MALVVMMMMMMMMTIGIHTNVLEMIEQFGCWISRFDRLNFCHLSPSRVLLPQPFIVVEFYTLYSFVPREGQNIATIWSFIHPTGQLFSIF